MKTPPLNHTITPTGNHCGIRAQPTDPPCNRPANWHIAWRLAPVANASLTCDTHLNTITGVYDYVDRHPATATCGMPGTGWQPGTPSRCVLAPTRPDNTGA